MDANPTPFISIIMPVYNSEKYLEHAVNSILDQDYDDYELILVDDGSTDESGKICDRLSNTHPQIRTFHISNGGMCAARNFGIAQSLGKYIGFCDNDDEYLPHYLREAAILANDSNADIVRFARRQTLITSKGTQPLLSVAGPSRCGVYAGDEIFRNYDNIRGDSGAVWNGIYRHSVIVENEITFDPRLRHGCEDTLFNISFLSVAKIAVADNRVFYNWIRRMGHSSSFVITDDFLLGTRMAAEQEAEIMEKHAVDQDNPGFYGSRITRYLMDPLEATLLADAMSYRSSLPLLKQLREIFKPYKNKVLACPISLSRKLFFSAVTSGRYRLAYTAMTLSRWHLRRMAR